MNSAFVFVKPHANNEKVQKLVRETFAARGVTITGEGHIDGSEIDRRKLIDQHYYAIGSNSIQFSNNHLTITHRILLSF